MPREALSPTGTSNCLRSIERTLKALLAIVGADGIERVWIMRAPAPGEPVVYGLG